VNEKRTGVCRSTEGLASGGLTERTESASQAEYAGSIPVIGSHLSSGNVASWRFGDCGGTYPIPTAGRGRSRVRAHQRNLGTF
jgi:hypothetical protein